MTQPSTTRRVATVSGGALLLCLSFGGTALAATSPTSGTDTSPISTVTGALPLPTPTDSPDPIGTVTSTVTGTIKTVTQTAGVPVPTATPTATPTVAPAPAPSGGNTGTTKHAPVQVTQPARHTSGSVLGVHQARVAPMSTTDMRSLQLGGLRGAPAPTVTDPVVAPAQTAVLAAGQAPALAPQTKAALPGGGSDERAPRGLFIALATMVIGGLAAGHVKVIQDRLSGITAG